MLPLSNEFSDNFYQPSLHSKASDISKGISQNHIYNMG